MSEVSSIKVKADALEGQTKMKICHVNRPDRMAEDSPQSEVCMWLEHWKSNWSWIAFFYNLSLDLLPTAWDSITDLLFAQALELVDVYSTGISYFFVCLPIFWILAERLAKTKISTRILCFSAGLPVGSGIIVFSMWVDPLLFRPVAYVCSAIFLGVKLLAVFLHTPEITAFSLKLSQVENSTEGPPQLLLIQHVWLSGGALHWDTLLSSLLVMGKSGAEAYLTAGPRDRLTGKPYLDRLLLVLNYLPVFMLNAAFRSGSGVINVINYSTGFFLPFSTAFVMFLTWVYIVLQNSLSQLWLSMLRLHLLPQLQELDLVELGHAVGSEGAGITMWGRLGRGACRLPQMTIATWFLLHNIFYISLVLRSTYIEDTGPSLWQIIGRDGKATQKIMF